MNNADKIDNIVLIIDTINTWMT